MANGATKELKMKLSVQDGISKPLQDIGNNAKTAFEGVEQSASRASNGLNQADESAQRVADAMSAAVPAFSAQEAAANKLDLTMRRLAAANDALANETDPQKQAALRVQIDNLTQSANRYKHELDDVGDEQQQASQSTDKMAQAIAAAGITLSIAFVAKAGKAIVELGELGAAAQRTERAFTNISGGATVAAAHLDAMMVATNGAISRTEAMAQAARLLQMGLVDSSESLGDFTEMAVRLGTAMGRETNQAIEEFSLLMSNQSIMRLDTFGISAAQVRVRIVELQEAFGMGREAAFMQAVEEIGTVAMERLGPAIEDNMHKIEQNRAAWADLRVEAGKVFADMVADGSAAFGTIARHLADQLILVDDLADAYGRAAVSRAYYNTVYQYGEGEEPDLEELINQQQRLTAETERYTGLAEYYATQQGEIATEIYDSADAWEQYSRAIADAESANADLVWQMVQAEHTARNQAEAELMLGAVHSDLSASFRETSDEMADMRSERADLIAQLDDLTAGHGRYITVQRESALSVADLALAQLQLADAQAKFAEEDDPLKAAKLGVQIENLQGKIEGAGASFTSMVDNGKKISEVEGAIAGVTGKIDELIGKTRESIRSFILQGLSAQLAIDDWNEAEIAFFADTAERFGMYDELWVQATIGIVTTAKAVEDGTKTATEGGDDMVAMSHRLADEAGVLREIAPVAFDETANAAGHAGAMIDSLVGVNSDAEGSFVDLRDTAVPAIDEVTMAAGLVGSTLMGAVADADLLKAALDLLAENDITIDVHFNVDELRVPSGRAQELQGPGLIQTPIPIMEAAGGDYIVNQPTPFIAGEAGPERAIFIPQGQPGFGGAAGGAGGNGGTWTGNMYINGAGDPAATAEAVVRRLQDRGILQQVSLR